MDAKQGLPLHNKLENKQMIWWWSASVCDVFAKLKQQREFGVMF